MLSLRFKYGSVLMIQLYDKYYGYGLSMVVCLWYSYMINIMVMLYVTDDVVAIMTGDLMVW